MMLLTSCSTTKNNVIPPWPEGSYNARQELLINCGLPIEHTCPALSEWLIALDKFKRQLEVAR